jgi:hypothetical protein
MIGQMPRVDENRPAIPTPHPAAPHLAAPRSDPRPTLSGPGEPAARNGERFLLALTAGRREGPLGGALGGPRATVGPAAAADDGQPPGTAAAARARRPRSAGTPAEESQATIERADALAPWQVREGPPRPPPAGRPAAVPPAAAAERLLVGVGPRGAEVRLRIGHGPLAGTEIHLRQLPGGIDALVLTRAESSRQTVAVAMEEVARRLGRKGYVFRAEARSPSAGDWPHHRPHHRDDGKG